MTTITVTAEHIASGGSGYSWGCPIALAMQEVIGDVDGVSVGEQTATICLDDSAGGLAWSLVELPDAACDFVEAFDNGWPVEPFTFEIDYPAATS